MFHYSWIIPEYNILSKFLKLFRCNFHKPSAWHIHVTMFLLSAYQFTVRSQDNSKFTDLFACMEPILSPRNCQSFTCQHTISLIRQSFFHQFIVLPIHQNFPVHVVDTTVTIGYCKWWKFGGTIAWWICKGIGLIGGWEILLASYYWYIKYLVNKFWEN